ATRYRYGPVPGGKPVIARRAEVEGRPVGVADRVAGAVVAGAVSYLRAVIGPLAAVDIDVAFGGTQLGRIIRGVAAHPPPADIQVSECTGGGQAVLRVLEPVRGLFAESVIDRDCGVADPVRLPPAQVNVF